jgi:ribosomal-protein-alanine N-acetyltransferase
MARADGQPYGLIAIGGVEPKDRSGVAWYLRGSGVERKPAAMTQCVALAMREAFQLFELHSISASVQAGNIASSKLLEAIGFKPVGVMREAFQVDGNFVDRDVFDLLESDLRDAALPGG